MVQKPSYQELELRLQEMTQQHQDETRKRVMAETALCEQEERISMGADIGKTLIGERSLPKILDHCASLLITHFESSLVLVWTLSPSEKTLELQASAGLNSHTTPKHSHIRLGEYRVGKIAEEKTPCLTNTLLDDTDICDQEWARQEKLVAFAGVPLMLEDEVAGVIAIFSRKCISKSKLKSLTAISDQIALRILRKRADEALAKSEERFRSLFEFAPNPICLEEIKSGSIRANRAMCELLGYSAEELLETSFEELTHPDENEIWSQKREILLNHQVPVCQFEKRYINKKGEIIWGITALSLLWGTDGSPNFFTVQIQDITHIKKLEGQLLHAQKMKAIGTLAGGIAHDFNNLLMGIQGRVSLMLLDTNQGESQFEHLKKIEEHIRRAANLTNQLLGFARGGKFELIKTDLTELIKKETSMFGRTRKEISIQQDYTQGLWLARVDRVQIRQVLLNIYINATQAMPDGGTLTIKTENVQLTRDDNKPLEIPPGRFVRISITDTGVGMDQGTRQRIFEPFFTTRQMGRGTGLGLASAYGIIRHHGGFINVYSEKGRGTTLSVYLPALDQDMRMKEKKTLKLMEGQGTVLLVDDEEMIIEIGRQMIQRLGYEVLTADSGEEAITIYTENRDIIDLVILDMIMPRMSGEETFDRLISADPEVKVVLSSGYSIDGKASEILNRGGTGFIQKPFNMNQLSETICAAMAAAPTDK